MNADELRAIKDLEQIDLPLKHFRGKLYDYQTVGTYWAAKVMRGLLADCTGAGKTIEAFALMDLLEQHDILRPCLILVKAATIDQWIEEFCRFMPEWSIVAIRGTPQQRFQKLARSPDIMILHYEMLVREPDILDHYPSFGLIVADEASTFKNPEAKTTHAVASLAARARRFISMSATPVETSLEDLWSILAASRILEGELPQRNLFKQRYMNIERKRITKGRHTFWIEDIHGYKNLRELKTMIEPYVLRRRITDISDQLPQVQIARSGVNLNTEHANAYRRALSSGVPYMTLQQILNKNPHANSRHAYPKLDEVVRLLRTELWEDKSVVYTMFLRDVQELSNRLRRAPLPNGRRGIEHVVVTGETRATRAQDLNRFKNDPNCKVLIGDMAINYGLNLQHARYLIMADIITNPAKVKQLVGRIRRPGSVSDTCVVIFVMANSTHESKYLRRAMERDALARFLMEDRTDGIFKKDWREVLAELGVNPTTSDLETIEQTEEAQGELL